MIRNIFPVNKEEINLVRFIGRYQYLSCKDTRFFFSGTYYPKRITRLIKNNILRRYKKNLVLTENGYKYLENTGQIATRRRYETKSIARYKAISHIAAFYFKDAFVDFIPSFEMKEKTAFTESSRKYIGVLSILKINYLIYHISEEHTTKYINAVIYDLQKESKYKNIIILVNDINRIKFEDFVFGFNSVIICEDSDEELENLRYLHQINWYNLICKEYKNEVHLSEYNFCEYTDNRKKYITTFYLIDTEKINKIKIFFKNNPNKKMDIICSENIVEILEKQIPIANYKPINLDNVIEKDLKIYE